MNPISVFNQIQKELTKTYHFSWPVAICVRGLSFIHRIWWLRRKKELIKPENIVPAALGTALEGPLRFTPTVIEQTVRGIAKLILIATRIDETIERMKSLGYAFNDLKSALKNQFPLVIEPQWIKMPQSIFLSVHSMNSYKEKGQELMSYIKRIYHCITQIFTKTFKLSMQLWDTYEAFVFSHDAIPEIFVNGLYWFRKIRHEKDYIQDKLENYRPLLQNVFDAIHSPLSADQLIDRTQSFLALTAESAEKVDQLNQWIGKKVIHQAKKITAVLKSKFLGKEFVEKPAHTPFVLKKLANII